MEGYDDVAFLFEISNEIKQFYETPIIYLTKNDFSDKIFNTMCLLRAALQEDKKKAIMDIIVDFHLHWIHAVNDVDNFKKRINHLPREELYQAISYTIDVLSTRLKYYERYMEKNRPALSNIDQISLNTDMEIVEEMHKDVTHNLLDTLKCFRGFADDEEFRIKIFQASENLLEWIDKISDNLVMQLSKYININVPNLASDLTKTLQQIVYDLMTSDSPSAHKILDDLKCRGREIGTMIRCFSSHSLEISKVEEMMNILDDHIKRLQSEPSSAAVLALSSKKEYLERRLSLFDHSKTTLKSLHGLIAVHIEDFDEEICICEDFYMLRIFNHALPIEDRERLVTELCYLWDIAIFGTQNKKSIISILSAAEMREEFVDELGTFYIDEHSRKIYKVPDDETLYQPNENNELVPVADDESHTYFYDECGRYFIDMKTRQRVYKAHGTASEYVMDSSGVLLKVKEVTDGTVYYYDNYGRYYINAEGKHIYRDLDTVSEYENDGLGNLVRIRSHLDIFELCPDDVNVTDDFKYLKQTVGSALKSCIAQCILHQPADPIKYLSAGLVKYRENTELKEKRASEKEQLFIERDNVAAKLRAAAEKAAMEAALLAHGGSEASYDSNLVRYEHADAMSASSTLNNN